MLALLADDLERQGVRLVVARDIGQVRDVLRRAGEDRPLAPAYPTVQAAVQALAADPTGAGASPGKVTRPG